MIGNRKNVSLPIAISYYLISLFSSSKMLCIYLYFKRRQCKRARSKQTDVTSCSSAVICNLSATYRDYNNITVRNHIFSRLFQFLNIHAIYSIYTIRIINIITRYSIFEKNTCINFCFCITNLLFTKSNRWGRESGNGKIYRAFLGDAMMYFIHPQSYSQRMIFLYSLAVMSKYVQD